MTRKFVVTGVFMIVAFGLVGPLAAAEEEGPVQKMYDIKAYHEKHDEQGVDCETCHLKPYRSQDWITTKGETLGGPSVGRYMMPQNLSREVDKVNCLECHRWGEEGARAWYGGKPAEAGDLYK